MTGITFWQHLCNRADAMRREALQDVRTLPALALLCACLPSFAAPPGEGHVEAVLDRMQALSQAREHKQLIELWRFRVFRGIFWCETGRLES